MFELCWSDFFFLGFSCTSPSTRKWYNGSGVYVFVRCSGVKAVELAVTVAVAVEPQAPRQI